jgi:adenylate cyclase
VQFSATLSWLIDEAAGLDGADRFLSELGVRLKAEGLPVAGGALSLEVAHPLIARRAWLWRADRNETSEALGFAPGNFLAKPAASPNEAERRWLSDLAPGELREAIVGAAADGPWLGWVSPGGFDPEAVAELQLVARFAAAPLAAISARATLSASLEAYLGRRSAAQALAAPMRRVVGETIEAALVFADLRGFTALSESQPPALVIAALDAWFDRIAGAIHAFGGEVLKLIGDGVLAIFPVSDGRPGEACEAALKAIEATRAGMARLNEDRRGQGLPPLAFGAALHLGEMLWGNIGAANRLDFTAIGRAVNLVSRLEGLCKPLQQTALASGAFAAEVKTPLIPLGEHDLRGIAAPCAVFALPER